MSNQQTHHKKVIVTGKGDSKQHAFASALNEIQKQLMQQTEVLLRVEPLEVEVLKAVEQTYTEHFLFFFFPRKKISYQVELAVTVAITQLNLATLPFTKLQTEDPEGIRLPFTTKKI